jgi:hypothetical protein
MPKPCEYVDKIPVYSKTIGNFTIDPSEYVSDKGAHIMDREIPCMRVADPGEKYCPRHKAIVAGRLVPMEMIGHA